MQTSDLIEKLDSSTRQLRASSLFVLFATVGNWFVLMFSMLKSLKKGILYNFEPSDLVLWSMMISFFVVMLLIMFEYTKKRGEAAYDVLADENHRGDEFLERKGISEREKVHMKLAFKEFTSSSNLPLAPGKYGPLSILVVNICIVLLVYLVFATYR